MLVLGGIWWDMIGFVVGISTGNIFGMILIMLYIIDYLVVNGGRGSEIVYGEFPWVSIPHDSTWIFIWRKHVLANVPSRIGCGQVYCLDMFGTEPPAVYYIAEEFPPGIKRGRGKPPIHIHKWICSWEIHRTQLWVFHGHIWWPDIN